LPSYKAIEDAYNKSNLIIKESVESFFDKVKVVSYESFLPVFYGLQNLLEIIYASINKRIINAYSFLGLIHFLIFCIFFSNIMMSYAKNLQGTRMGFSLVPNDTRAMYYARHYGSSIFIRRCTLGHLHCNNVDESILLPKIQCIHG